MVLQQILTDFNPLPRKEGDLKQQVSDFKSQYISIHSLVKRETQAQNTKMP